MGRKCGYLSLMSGLATGAEKVYLNEEGITLKGLAADSERMVESFRSGRSLYLVIRNERASVNYTTDVLAHIFAEEGKGLYDVREAILGHQQQGGSPTAFDRIMATKLVAHSLELLACALKHGEPTASYVGLVGGKVSDHPLDRMNDDLDRDNRRPPPPVVAGPAPRRGAGQPGHRDPGARGRPDFGEAVDDAAS